MVHILGVPQNDRNIVSVLGTYQTVYIDTKMIPGVSHMKKLIFKMIRNNAIIIILYSY